MVGGGEGEGEGEATWSVFCYEERKLSNLSRTMTVRCNARKVPASGVWFQMDAMLLLAGAGRKSKRHIVSHIARQWVLRYFQAAVVYRRDLTLLNPNLNLTRLSRVCFLSVSCSYSILVFSSMILTWSLWYTLFDYSLPTDDNNFKFDVCTVFWNVYRKYSTKRILLFCSVRAYARAYACV